MNINIKRSSLHTFAFVPRSHTHLQVLRNLYKCDENSIISPTETVITYALFGALCWPTRPAAKTTLGEQEEACLKAGSFGPVHPKMVKIFNSSRLAEHIDQHVGLMCKHDKKNK